MSSSLQALIEDSRQGLTLMESDALADWHDTPALAQALRQYIEAHPDHESFHCLFALRRSDEPLYDEVLADTRARVLTAALGHVRFLNDWGVLDVDGCDDGEAGLALIALSVAALPALRPCLDDDRPAPLFGSEEATLSALHRYRRKDFAYRVVARILQMPFRFDPRPADRDRHIERLKAELA